jgi:hypothetical protein
VAVGVVHTQIQQIQQLMKVAAGGLVVEAEQEQQLLLEVRETHQVHHLPREIVAAMEL